MNGDGASEKLRNGADAKVDFSFDDLVVPDMRPRSLIRHFGPGMILMMTGIGTSHLVTAPVAGGRFEYALLWCILVAYVFKYYGFEMAFRFTNATGKSLIAAYATAPGKLPVWYVLVTTIVQCGVGQAGRLVAAAAVLYYLFSATLGAAVPLWAWAALIGVGSVVALLRGQYAALETGAKVAGGLLFASAVIVYVVRPAPAAEMAAFFVFDAPEGSWIVIAALLGLLPTGLDVSLQASEWGKAKRAGMSRIRDRLENAGLARPFDPFAPKASDLTVDVSRLPERAAEYSRRCFSTAFNYFDGWPRIVGACARNLFPATAALRGTARDRIGAEHRRRWFSEYNIYRATMIYSLAAAVVFVALVPRPVFLVLIASALATFVAPVIFFLNFHYCVKVIPKEDRFFYPSLFARTFTMLSIAVFSALSVVSLIVLLR